MARVIDADSHDAGTDHLTDAPFFDPYAHGASTTGDDYSAASGMTARESKHHTAYSNAVPTPRTQTFRDLVPRPVATSTKLLP